MKVLGLHIRWPLAAAAAVTGLAAYGAYVAAPKPATPLGSARTAARPQPSHKPSRVTAVKPSVANSAPTLRAIPTQASYERAIRTSLFSAPLPPEPRPAPPPAKPPPAVIIPVPPPDPLADAVYRGSATVDGNMTALIESRATHQGEYVFAEGSWQGHKIVEIAKDHITLSVNGVTRTLMASDEMNVVPLSSSAVPAGGPAGQTPAPGQAPQVSGQFQDAATAQAQMLLKYKMRLESGSKLMEMRNMETDLKATQDKSIMLKISK